MSIGAYEYDNLDVGIAYQQDEIRQLRRRIRELEAALAKMPCAPGVWPEDCPRCKALKETK